MFMFPLSKHYKSSGCLSRPALSVNSCKRWLAQCQGCLSSKVGAAVLPSFQSSNNEHRRYLLGDQSCQMAASFSLLTMSSGGPCHAEMTRMTPAMEVLPRIKFESNCQCPLVHNLFTSWVNLTSKYFLK